MFFKDKGYHIYWFEQVASKLLRIIITLDHNPPANGYIFYFKHALLLTKILNKRRTTIYVVYICSRTVLNL